MTRDLKCPQAAKQPRKRPAPVQVPMNQVANIQTPERSYIGCTGQQHALAGKARNYSPPRSSLGPANLAQSKAHTTSEVIVQKPARAYTSQRAQKHHLAVKAKQNSPPPTPPPRQFNLAESKARYEAAAAAAAEKISLAQTQEQDSLSPPHDNTRIIRWLEHVPEYEYSTELVGGPS